MPISKNHSELTAERARILEDILPRLFKDDFVPPSHLVKNIALHLSISKRPDLLQNPRSVKINTAKIYEKYGVEVEVVHDNLEERQAICPLSQSRVVVPWMGACGHVFEESVIKKYIENKEVEILGKRRGRNDASGPVVGCPVIGCNKMLVRNKE
ncbi:hypothetical protein PAEPH01_2529 [Pancytospora epiphaga]|nr:hypothetical protein PAEPH01_2529 [Pancytospora epiphaga]